MNILSFVLGLVRALAWPAAVGLAVFVLRRQIAELFSAVGKTAERMHAKLGPLELDINRALALSTTTTTTTSSVTEENFELLPPPTYRYRARLREEDYYQATINAFNEITDYLRDLLIANEIDVPATMTDVAALADLAAQNSLVTSEAAKACKFIPELRERVSSEIEIDFAYSIFSALDNVLFRLKNKLT